MKAELRICLNFSSKEYERETTREDLAEEFVSVDDMIPVVEDKTAQAWVESKLELLKLEGLVG